MKQCSTEGTFSIYLIYYSMLFNIQVVPGQKLYFIDLTSSSSVS